MAERPALRSVQTEAKKNPALSVVSDSKSWLRSTTAILVCLISVGFFARVVVSALIVQRQTKLDEITETISEVDAMNRSLLFEIMKLESTERIYRIALADISDEVEGIQGLGMMEPGHTEFLQPLSSSNFSNFENSTADMTGVK